MATDTAQSDGWLDRTIARAARVGARELEPAAPSDVDLARYALRLALNPRPWVRRRVETFEFLDADTVRRRMSVDFEVPESSRFDPGAIVYVPLMLLAKRDLRNFNMRDEDGRTLSVLNSEENGELATNGLLRYLARAVDPTAAQRTVLGGIVKNRPSKGERRAESALAVGGVLRPLVDAVPAGREREAIKAMITQLDDSFLLLVGIPYEPGRRRVLKFSYDAEHRTGEDATLPRRLYYAVTRLGASLGVLSRVERFEDLVVGLGGSYHAEAVAPADTYVDDAQLAVEGRAAPKTDRHRFRPHMHVASKSRGDRGALTLWMHAQREGLVLPLLLAAAAISATLAFVPERHESLDGQTLAALLLVPFALAAFFIRSAENSYVTRMLRGVRLVAVIPVAAGVVTIAMLGLRYLDPPGTQETDATVREIARYAANASIGATAWLLLAAVAPMLGRPLRRGVELLVMRPGPWSVPKWVALGLTLSFICVITPAALAMLVSKLI